MFWGLVSQVHVLRVEVPDVGFKPLVLREKLVFVSSLLIMGCVGGWLHGAIAASPARFSVGFFSFCQCVGVTQPVWGFFSENCCICSCRFSVSVGGDGFRILLRCHLGLEPKCFYMEKYLRCVVKVFFQDTKLYLQQGFVFVREKNTYL